MNSPWGAARDVLDRVARGEPQKPGEELAKELFNQTFDFQQEGNSGILRVRKEEEQQQ